MGGRRAVVLFIGFIGGNMIHELRLEGARRFSRPFGWDVEVLRHQDSSPSRIRAAIAAIRPDGCLVDLSLVNSPMPRSIFGETPTVFFDLHSRRSCASVANVLCDNAAVAETAFRELSSGLPPAYAVATYRMRRLWARERVAKFRSLCQEAGAQCSVLAERHGESPGGRAARIAAWAASLPRNVAVFAVNDFTAKEVLDAFQSIGRHVPRSATVIGVDGLDARQEVATSRISTIRLDFERTGYIGARILAEKMANAGEWRRDAFSATFGPLMVIRRESTRGRGRSEPYILKAVDAIRREACDGLTARALAGRFPVSRNLFERRFREATGHSVLDEILHVRLEVAQSMLARPGMPIGAIADFSGFGTVRELRKLFRSRTGMSPRQWRAAHCR